MWDIVSPVSIDYIYIYIYICVCIYIAEKCVLFQTVCLSCCFVCSLKIKKDMRLHLDKMARRCTSTDMLYLVRLIKHDLRINARASVVLGALGDGAYDAFNANKNLATLLPKIVALTNDSRAASGGGGGGGGGGGAGDGLPRKLSSSMQIGQAVKPQLASAIKSTEIGFKKCPNGCFAEIKYE